MTLYIFGISGFIPRGFEKKFDTIDDIPDANIKSAIRAAIAEWEPKYVPGA